MISVPAIVYEFPRANDREFVRASLQQYEGRDVFDLRVWLPRSSDGVLVPGAKGLTVDRSLLPELEAAVRAARIATATVTQGEAVANASIRVCLGRAREPGQQ